MAISYKDAGVDLDSYAEAMGRLPALISKTTTPRVLPLMGGFAGLFQLNGNGHQYKNPVLVSGTDGVGTKLKVAMLAKKHDTVGIDLVAMCVNDCICLGAEPLFFLDYLALASDDPQLTSDLVKGVADGCIDAQAALIGGETAIMPDLYAPGEFDMAGFCVGVVEKDHILDGSHIKPGDVLVGVESSGLHSNGFSLVRKAVFDVGGLDISSHVQELKSTVGDVLLTPTRIYARLTQALNGDESLRPSITGIAHITGGGLAENIGRIMPAGACATVDRSRWEVPAVFQWIQGLGDIEADEMSRVFNMGIGLTLVVRPEVVDQVRAIVQGSGYESHLIGEVTQGEKGGKYA